MIKNFLLLSVFFSLSVHAQTVFEEKFDTEESVVLWSREDLDGDGMEWDFYDAEESQLANFTGGIAVSFSWLIDPLTPDNTLTSPVIKLPNANELILDFKVAGAAEDSFKEHYAVYVIPANSTFTGSETPVFEETLDAAYLDVAKKVNVDISTYAGQDVQLVFRHYDVTDQLYIILDEIRITKDNLSTTEVNQLKAVVYQDQVNGLVKIANVNQVERVKLFDLAGNLLIDVKQSEANISSLPKGIYIVNFYTGDNVISRKIVKK